MWHTEPSSDPATQDRRSRERRWVAEAIRKIESDTNRSADTHLHVFPLPESWGIDLYLKDESVHPTGSLKHRLARSLFLYGLVNGDITAGTTVVDATSGSTAISEAWFARLLGLDFLAVLPRTTSRAKLDLIERSGGRCHAVDHPSELYAEAERLGALPGHHYLDQFGRASIVTDWRGNNNIASSIFDQLTMERHPIPEWIVVGAGTGGTSATIGRYLRYRQVTTRLCVVDPEGSVFHQAWRDRRHDVTSAGSEIEGIGRPRVEPSFVPSVIDDMLVVPNAATVAAMRLVERLTGRRVGASTGTNIVGALAAADRMRKAGQAGSIVSLICDDGVRYTDTYWDNTWVRARGWDITPHLERLESLLSES